MQLAQVSYWQLANWLVQMPKSVGLIMSSLGRRRAGPVAHGWTGPVAHGWNRTEFDPQTPGRVMPSYPPGRSTRPGPDAGPGDAVLPRDVPPGPALPTQRTGELTPLI